MFQPLGLSGPKTPSNFPTHLASREFAEEFRGAVGLAEVEVGRCGQHADLSPAVLGGNQGFEGPPVFRVCVQGLGRKRGRRLVCEHKGPRPNRHLQGCPP